MATEGVVYCIEFSKKAYLGLLENSRKRNNLIPILGNASNPEEYSPLLEEVDIIYQDIAQPNQTEILTINAEYFLKKEGHALLAVKARSIDVAERPETIFRREKRKLRKVFQIEQSIDLSPYEKDHLFLSLSLKSSHH